MELTAPWIETNNVSCVAFTFQRQDVYEELASNAEVAVNYTQGEACLVFFMQYTFDHFELERFLGNGNFSEVFEVTEKGTSNTYALKVFNRVGSDHEFLVSALTGNPSLRGELTTPRTTFHAARALIHSCCRTM